MNDGIPKLIITYDKIREVFVLAINFDYLKRCQRHQGTDGNFTNFAEKNIKEKKYFSNFFLLKDEIYKSILANEIQNWCLSSKLIFLLIELNWLYSMLF